MSKMAKDRDKHIDHTTDSLFLNRDSSEDLCIVQTESGRFATVELLFERGQRQSKIIHIAYSNQQPILLVLPSSEVFSLL